MLLVGLLLALLVLLFDSHSSSNLLHIYEEHGTVSIINGIICNTTQHVYSVNIIHMCARLFVSVYTTQCSSCHHCGIRYSRFRINDFTHWLSLFGRFFHNLLWMFMCVCVREGLWIWYRTLRSASAHQLVYTAMIPFVNSHYMPYRS